VIVRLVVLTRFYHSGQSHFVSSAVTTAIVCLQRTQAGESSSQLAYKAMSKGTGPR
jgi:hypothetical protein